MKTDTEASGDRCDAGEDSRRGVDFDPGVDIAPGVAITAPEAELAAPEGNDHPSK